MNSSNMMSPPTIAASLVIPTYQREELLVETLRCALAQDREDYEIIVVDQTPRHAQATSDFLNRHADEIRLVPLSAPSLTAARNAGIRVARGEIIIFVDDDTSFEADFISRHLEAHGKNVGAVQGRVVESGGREQTQPMWVNRWIRFRGGNDCKNEGATNNLTGCNFSLSREAIGEVGLFDERFTGVAVHEDSDYALRVGAAGYRLRFAPLAKVVHHRASSGGVDSHVRVLFFDRSYYFNELLFAKKHFSRAAVWLYRWRLKRRGRRALAKLIMASECETDRAIEDGSPGASVRDRSRMGDRRKQGGS